MKPTSLAGLHEDRGLLWTRNRVPGRTVYGERLRASKGQEYRSWEPYRSKLAALARKDAQAAWPDPKRDVLYLGASTGTTVSHVSDMLHDGARVYAVEFSPRSVRDLLWNVEPRDNVVPILEDAGVPQRYAAFIDRPVGTLIQDVAQRHQVELLLRNLPFVAPGGLVILFVKARSIDVARPVKQIYQDVADRLQAAGLRVAKQVDLEPFEQDHRAFLLHAPPGAAKEAST